MKIKDKGIILAKRPRGEKSAIVSVLTKEYGICTFYAQNIAGKNSVVYQLGNVVDLFVSSRLDEHMGLGRCELIFSASHCMRERGKLYAINSLLSVILSSFEEGVTHPALFDQLIEYIKNIGAFDIMYYLRLESLVLSEAGYGLDLSKCIVSGATENLKYVSPKSGAAVSALVGEEYKDKLLLLPACALNSDGDVSKEELVQMADLLLYFFKRYVFKYGEPVARQELVKYIKEA